MALRGTEELPAEPELISCGPWTLLLQGADVRSLSKAGTELISHIYPTVRDRDWNTIAAEISLVEKSVQADRVRLGIDGHTVGAGIDLAWHGVIDLSSDGVFRYELTGCAGADFDYCRIGFCLLVGASAACGRPYRASTPQGAWAGTLPMSIAPQPIVDGLEQPLFPACREFELDLPEGTVRAEFEGDLFELEDQRNWSDFSFKLYCTPIALGYPLHARAGQQFRQRVVVSTDISGPGQVTADGRRVTLDPTSWPLRRRPRLGIGQSSVLDRPMTPVEAELITTLRPDHLRVDVQLGRPGWAESLRRSIVDAGAIGSGLELAVHVGSGISAGDDVLVRLGDLLRTVAVRRILVLDADSRGTATTTPTQLRAVRDALRASDVAAAVGGGTDGDFAEINRDRPDVTDLDFLAYAMNPQVHVFDDLSLILNLPAQASTVRTARSFAGATPVAVTPVTLRQRFNPVASTPEPAAATGDPGRLPPSVDPRQLSQFAAVWTLGSLVALIAAGVDSITYFETVGWRGVLERSTAEVSPGPFHSRPGMVFPVFHLWRDVSEDIDGDHCAPVLDSAAGLAALAMPVTGGRRVVIANLSPARREVTVASLAGAQARVRILDSSTATQAACRPLEFRRSWSRLQLSSGRAMIVLGPYAYARVDLSGSATWPSEVDQP